MNHFGPGSEDAVTPFTPEQRELHNKILLTQAQNRGVDCRGGCSSSVQ